MGSLIVFSSLMLVFLSSYSFVLQAKDLQAAKALSADIQKKASDIYSSDENLDFEYFLPAKLDGLAYSLELRDKGDYAAIVTVTENGAGAASLGLELANSSFGILKHHTNESGVLCFWKNERELFLEPTRCN